MPHNIYNKISLFLCDRTRSTHSSDVAYERDGHDQQLSPDPEQPSAVDAAAGEPERRNAAHHGVPAAERHRVPHPAAAAASHAANSAAGADARAAQAAKEGRDGGAQTRAHRPHQVDCRRPERPVPDFFRVSRSKRRPAAASAAAGRPGAILLRADHWHHSADLAAADAACPLLPGCDHLPRCAHCGPWTTVTGRKPFCT
jgi:hypothetical protein